MGKKEMDKKLNTYEKTAFWIAVFAGIFCLCFFVHPQVILDYDDWSYVSELRIPFPWPTFWNPSRVLPEVLMPAFGYLGALIYRFFPELGYIRSEALSYSLAQSIFETVYLYMFAELLAKRFGSADRKGYLRVILLTGVFFVFHFLTFRTEQENNEYLFRTANLTCCFFYLIPALLNLTAVMLFAGEPERFDAFFSKDKQCRILPVLVLVYFCVFSNLFANIIIAVYALYRIMADLIRKRSLRKTVKKNSLFIVVLALWTVSVVFEAFGGRAQVTDGEMAFADSVSAVCRYFFKVVGNVNPVCIVVTVIAVIMWFVLEKNSEDGFSGLFLQMIVCAAIVLVYLILLCAKVDVVYIGRPEVLISFFSLMYIAVCVSLARIVRKYGKGWLPVAGVFLLMIACTYTPGNTFAESYPIDARITPETCIAISQDIVNQVVEADRTGKTDVVIDVAFNGAYDDNWPQCVYLGEALVPALYRHGVIKSPVNAEIFPSMEFNARYKLDFPLLPYEAVVGIKDNRG